MFDHMSNKPIFGFNTLVNLSPEDFQNLESVNVLNK